MSLDKDYLKDLFTDEVKGCLKSDGDPVGTAASAVSEHNTSEDAHSDIRKLLNSEPYIVTVTVGSDGTLSSDKTYEEIRSAINNGKVVFALYENAYFSMVAFSEGGIMFGMYVPNGESFISNAIIINSMDIITFMSGTFGAEVVELFDGSNNVKLTPSEIVQAVSDGKILTGAGYVWNICNSDENSVTIQTLSTPNTVLLIGIGADKNFETVTMELAKKEELTLHESNTNVHITLMERVKWNRKSDFSGSYNDLADKPTIPTVPSNVSAFTNDAGYLTQHQDISGKEDSSNKVTTLSASSTDTQYPSAKCVYDMIGNVEALLAAL